MNALGVQGVSGDGDPGQVVASQQSREAGDLIGLVGDPQLGDGPTICGHRGQQVGGGRCAVPGTAGGLAIHGHRVRTTGISAGQLGQTAWTDQVDDSSDRCRTGPDAQP